MCYYYITPQRLPLAGSNCHFSIIKSGNKIWLILSLRKVSSISRPVILNNAAILQASKINWLKMYFLAFSRQSRIMFFMTPYGKTKTDSRVLYGKTSSFVTRENSLWERYFLHWPQSITQLASLLIN